jgi:hypothetical protein
MGNRVQLLQRYEEHHRQCAEILMKDAHLCIHRKDYAKAIERLELAIEHLKHIVAQ